MWITLYLENTLIVRYNSLVKLEELQKKLTGGATIVSGKNSYQDVKTLRTGLPALDYAITKKGGLPLGRIVEIFGKESDAKTALACTIIANAQKENKRCVFVDAEQTFNFDYAQVLGVDTDKLTIVRALYGEEYLEVVEEMIKEKMADVIVIDSIDALNPKPEQDATMMQATMGVKARMMSRFCRKVIEPLAKSKCLLICVNQTRVNIMTGFEDTGGGKGLKFYSSVRIKMHHTLAVKQGDNIVGKRIKMTIVKNKVGVPSQVVESNFLFESGFDRSMDLLDMAIQSGVIHKEKTTLFFGKVKLGIGLGKARLFLEDNPDVAKAIEEKV